MTKIHKTPSKSRKYKDAPEPDIDKLAERWVEMMMEILLAKDKEGLQTAKIFHKLTTD